LLLTGERVDPRRALDLGIVDRVMPADRLLPDAIGFARTLSMGPALAIGEIKLAAKKGIELPLDGGLALEREAIGRLFASKDAAEGMAAFAEKRKPSWNGE
jgi:enoyl-CoA hydratase